MIRVAIVDDHKLFRQGLAFILGQCEEITLCFEASNGLELEECLKEEEIDIVLMDLEMPERNGEESLKWLKKQHPNIKVLILSMHREDHFILDLLEKGAHGYLIKDSDPEELEKAIFQLDRAGVYMSQYISELLLKRLRNEAKQKNFGDSNINSQEQQLLRLLAKGLTTNEIAAHMFLSPRTIEGYRKNLLAKTGTNNVAALVAWGFRMGLVD